MSAAVDPYVDTIIQSAKYNLTSPISLTSLDTLQSILRNPQTFENITRLYQYCDYYINYDSICAGAIKNIFIPFSQAPYRLVGGNKKTRDFFTKIFDKNNLEDIVRGCANDYHKYGNLYVYLNDDYSIQMLPPHRCEVENIAIDGEPVVAFEIDRTTQYGKVDIEDIERKYNGYPKEILEGAKKGQSFVRLSIGKVFSVSYSKASWEKYAIPPLTAALPWLVQKETLNKTLITELDNMRATFLHVKVGDKDKNPIPGEGELRGIGKIFTNVLGRDGGRVAATTWNVDADFKNGGTKDSLAVINDMMANINWNVLSALSVSSVLATGDNLPNTNASSNFSTIQAAVTLVNKRINAFLDDLTKMFNKIIRIISLREGFRSYPVIQFEIVDLSDDKSVTELLMNLYDKGFISKETIYEHTKFDFNEELEKRKYEANDGIDKILAPPEQPYNRPTSDDDGGRPELDMDERTTDIDGKNENPRPSDIN